MCYKSPGPRCSSSALRGYKKAQSVYADALETGDDELIVQAHDELDNARKDYYMTPAGQDELRQEIEATGDPDGMLAMRLEYGINARNAALDALHEKDQGDLDQETEHSDETRVPMNLYASYSLEELRELKEARTSSDEFMGLIKERDETRDQNELDNQAVDAQKARVEELQKVAKNWRDKFPEDEAENARETLDEEYDKLREAYSVALDSFYAKKIANHYLEQYKDETVQVVAAMNERLGDPGVAFEGETLGNCVETSKYDSGTREWLEERQGGIGGSDVGDMLGADKKYAYENKLAFIKSKTETYSEEEVAEQAANNANFTGPAGRGNAWEPEIIREFVDRHPEENVMYSKASWVHKDDPRFKANVDGLLSSDGVNPDGILEIKTISHRDQWHGPDGEELVPVSYRAQVLWYLEQTGFKRAKIVGMIDDHEYVERDIMAGEPVDPEPLIEGGMPRIPSIPETMGLINKVWEDEVTSRRNGTFTPRNITMKAEMDDAHFKDSARARKTAQQLSAWGNISEEEANKQLRGYNAYAKKQLAQNGSVLTRDEYSVALFQKYSSPEYRTKDRVYVDIETSGASPRMGEIIQVGILRVNPKGEVVYRHNENFDLRTPEAREIAGTGMTEVHHIFPKDIAGKRRFTDPDVQKIMTEHLNDPNTVMIAHNDSFECRFFNQDIPEFWSNHENETGRTYRERKEGRSGDRFSRTDTMWLSKHLVHETKNNKLATFSEFNGVPYENAHDAYTDASMMRDAEETLAKRLLKGTLGQRPTGSMVPPKN